MDEQVKAAEPEKTPAEWESNRALTRVLQAAWMSIALGVAMEVLTLVAQAAMNDAPQLKKILAETVQRVSWSTLVCMGLGIGTVASRMRGTVMGVLGFISAPVGFLVAKSTHKGVSQLLSLPINEMPGGLLAALVITKGLEYAVLGVLLGYVPRTRWDTLSGHLLIALGCGAIFGGALIAETYWFSNPVQAVKMAVTAVNELVFPLGCALVIFFARALSRDIATPT